MLNNENGRAKMQIVKTCVMKEMNYITKQEMAERNLEKPLYNNQTIKIPLAKFYLLLFVVIRRCFKRQQ